MTPTTAPPTPTAFDRRFLAMPMRMPPPIPERDPTCPDCKGRCQDKHGFDCVRCAGEGVVDE
jgi:hypothetical protein